jgi:plasmid replication initiation protein
MAAMNKSLRQDAIPTPKQEELFPLKGTSSFRDDRELMSLPFFSISKQPRHEPIEHRYTVDGIERYVRVTGGEKGIATIWDNDVLIYARTLIVFHVNDFLVSTGRDTNQRSYSLFKEAVMRLQTTTVFTNIAAGDFVEDSGFGWLQSFRMRKVKRRDGKEVIAACEITLCDWLYSAAVAERFIAVERSYFALTSALERKLWLIVRRHLGRQPRWFIGLDKLQERCASQREARKFRHEIKRIVESDPFPDFHLSLTDDPRPLLGPTPVGALRPGRALYLVAKARPAN